jgi:hypothetical protein
VSKTIRFTGSEADTRRARRQAGKVRRDRIHARTGGAL